MPPIFPLIRLIIIFFHKVLEDAKELSEMWGVTPTLSQKRTCTKKRFYDEHAVDERIMEPEKNFRCTVLNAAMDVLVIGLEERFLSMSSVVDKFDILSPATLASVSDEKLLERARNLANMYSEDVGQEIGAELISFREILQPEISTLQGISDFAHFLIVDNSSLAPSYRNICVVLLLFLTLPVTVASADRSFSKLKIIKNHLRSTVHQERLSGLALVSVESARAREMNMDQLVLEFAESKARKKSF
jgi:hypothetical protein